MLGVCLAGFPETVQGPHQVFGGHSCIGLHGFEHHMFSATFVCAFQATQEQADSTAKCFEVTNGLSLAQEKAAVMEEQCKAERLRADTADARARQQLLTATE